MKEAVPSVFVPHCPILDSGAVISANNLACQINEAEQELMLNSSEITELYGVQNKILDRLGVLRRERDKVLGGH